MDAQKRKILTVSFLLVLGLLIILGMFSRPKTISDATSALRSSPVFAATSLASRSIQTYEGYQNSVTVAAINFHSEVGDKATNLNRIEEYVLKAVNKGVNIIVFPEAALTGYMFPIDMGPKLAEEVPGSSTDKIVKLTSQYDVYVVFGLIERDGGKHYNSAALIGPNGVIGVYRKMDIRPDWKWCSPGTDIPIFETKYGPIGMSICVETYAHPEIARVAALKGARLLLNPTAAPTFGVLEDTQAYMLHQVGARVGENGFYVVSADSVGIEAGTQFCGYSHIVGPKPNAKLYHLYGGPASGTEEEMIVATLDLSLSESRNRPPGLKEIWKKRQPKNYLPIVAETDVRRE
jgi:predicted amidohydrolase